MILDGPGHSTACAEAAFVVAWSIMIGGRQGGVHWCAEQGQKLEAIREVQRRRLEQLMDDRLVRPVLRGSLMPAPHRLFPPASSRVAGGAWGLPEFLPTLCTTSHWPHS